MQAQARRRAPGVAADPRRPAPDSGSTVIEMMVSIAVIGVIMLSLSSFFVRSPAVVAHQRTEQAAILVATARWS
jgi:type II secretory pathway pseudopilin PulG